jgi:hypothetical protein
MDSMALHRGWSAAGSAEIMVERRMNKLDAAAEHAQELSQKARQWTTRWTNELMPEDEYNGVGRFGHTQFGRHLDRHSRRRIYTAASGSDYEPGELRMFEADGAMEVAHHRPGLSNDWFDRQVALGEFIDMLEENTERMESMAAETDFAASERLSYAQWEALPSPADTDHEEARALLAQYV